ncbi:MAG: hypothetical protein KME25_00560 [Symplocastrum torsivum CPER-KK1]|jgi:hypothetical protein|uniref:Uncharacterized protein n=1 Tax=Symplocastrum torsivum CPER-KK1 TaxID=450513 RepID=A0A951PFR3_9CYAN|nr:hypothetical protein [Symplocastrum torsivum CPER-KK1]
MEHYYFWADHQSLDESKLPEYLSILGAGEQGRAYEVCIASRLALTAIAAGDLTINEDTPDSWKAHLESLGFTNVLYSST